MHLESPALKVLEISSRCWKVLEFRCQLYPTQQTPKDIQDIKIACVVEEVKKTYTEGSFFIELSP